MWTDRSYLRELKAEDLDPANNKGGFSKWVT